MVVIVECRNLVVIILSTLAFLPCCFYAVIKVGTRLRDLSAEARFEISSVFRLQHPLCKSLSLHFKDEGVWKSYRSLVQLRKYS